MPKVTTGLTPAFTPTRSTGTTGGPSAPTPTARGWSARTGGAPAAAPAPTSDQALTDGLRGLADAGSSLKVGDQGPQVLQLQNALKKLGYTMVPDGKFGPATATALDAFARNNGLPAKAVATPELERSLALRLDRNAFSGAIARLSTTFSNSDPRFFEETQNALRAAHAEPDPARKSVLVSDWLDHVAARAEAHAGQLNAIQPNWGADLDTVRAHFSDAAQVPGAGAAELQFARSAFTDAASQQFASNVRVVSDALRAEDPAKASAFLALIDQLESADPKDTTPVEALHQFMSANGIKAEHQQRPEVRRAFAQLEGTVLEAERGNNLKPVVGFMQQTFVRHTLESIHPDPSDPGSVKLDEDLKARLAKLEAAAGTSSKALTGDTLRKIVPGLTPAYAAELATSIQSAMDQAKIVTPREKAAFIAQCAHETMNFKSFHELGDAAYFSKYDDRADLGNRGPPDGATYKGRGALQITGRANYAAFSNWVQPGGREYVDHPDRLENPGPAFQSAAWFWSSHNLNKAADANDFKLVTERINGGTNGWADRLQLYTRALAALGN